MENESLDEGRSGEAEGNDRLDTAMLRSIIDALLRHALLLSTKMSILSITMLRLRSSWTLGPGFFPWSLPRMF